MDERKAYWFEQPYMPRMKNIAVAPVILEDGRLSFCVSGDGGPPWSGVWNLTGKAVLDGDDYFYEGISQLAGAFFVGKWRWRDVSCVGCFSEGCEEQYKKIFLDGSDRYQRRNDV